METLREIIEWLKHLEGTAYRLYEKASEVYQDDKGLSDFLRQLSADEKLHLDLVLRAGEYLSSVDDFKPVISLDPETRKKVERPFMDLSGRLSDGGLSREELLNGVVTLEFSEVNHIFLYVMDSIRERSPGQFNTAAASQDRHKDRLRAFLSEREEFRGLLKRIEQIPQVLKERILIVDDRDVNLSLLSAVLEGEGSVESARDGDEALRKIEKAAFSAVVADLEMPKMDGIELYKRTVERRPELRDRFVFFSASPSPEHIHFFLDHKLRYLLKPAPISEIRRTVRSVLHSN